MAVQARLVAVVVTHNRLPKMRVTLERLLQTSRASLQAVIVVNNGSSDGTTCWLKAQREPRLYVLNHAENLGGAAGFAHGIQAAIDRYRPDWLVLMDDDARPWGETLERFSQNKRDFNTIYASAVFAPDGGICEMNRPFLNPFQSLGQVCRACLWGKKGYYVPYRAYTGAEPHPVDYATFVGFFVSRETVERVGLPDPVYFLYCDDLAYCDHLARSGCRILFDPELRFQHDCTSFQNQRHRIYTPVWKAYYAHRNGLIFLRNAAGRWFSPVACGLAVVWVLRAPFYGSQAGRYLKVLRWALKDGALSRFARPHPAIVAAAQGSVLHDSRKAQPDGQRPGAAIKTENYVDKARLIDRKEGLAHQADHVKQRVVPK